MVIGEKIQTKTLPYGHELGNFNETRMEKSPTLSGLVSPDDNTLN